jgi:hypothetical protein
MNGNTPNVRTDWNRTGTGLITVTLRAQTMAQDARLAASATSEKQHQITAKDLP